MYAPHTPLATQRESGLPSPEAVPVLDDHEIDRAARTDACVLFTGPVHVRTLALRIHTLSGWRWGPFVAVDCSSSDAVLESQLFSVLEADAATAERQESDVSPTVRLLQPGTIFLHEVGRLTLPAQARLRDLIGEPWPSDRSRRSRRRIMASTSESLLPRVASGTFDDRLFYRLNVMHFVLQKANGHA